MVGRFGTHLDVPCEERILITRPCPLSSWVVVLCASSSSREQVGWSTCITR
jgi:hypothetical protein